MHRRVSCPSQCDAGLLLGILTQSLCTVYHNAQGSCQGFQRRQAALERLSPIPSRRRLPSAGASGVEPVITAPRAVRPASPAAAAVSIHNAFAAECGTYFVWQTLGLVYSFERSGQPGPLTRLISCTGDAITLQGHAVVCVPQHSGLCTGLRC